MDLFNLRMYLAALRQLLRDKTEEMSESERLRVWTAIEKIQDLIEELEK